MHNDDYYEQFEPMPDQYKEIESIIQSRIKDVAKDLVFELGLARDSIARKDDEIKRLNKISFEYKRFKEKTEKDMESYSKECALKYLRDEAGIEGVTYGDSVYKVLCNSKYIKCPECNATGKIIVKHKGDDLEVNCPSCSNGSVSQKTFYVKEYKIIGFSCRAKQGYSHDSGYTLKTELSLLPIDATKKDNCTSVDSDRLNHKSYYSAWYKSPEDAAKYCEEKITI